MPGLFASKVVLRAWHTLTDCVGQAGQIYPSWMKGFGLGQHFLMSEAVSSALTLEKRVGNTM